MLLASFAAFPVFAAEETVFHNAAEVLDFVMVDKAFTTPIRIVPGQLYLNGVLSRVWLIALLGMKSVPDQVNSARGGGVDAYCDLVKQILTTEIPEGSALVFAGHSLGGMTAQMLRADAYVTSRYQVVNVLCGGSPLMEPAGEPEGALYRLTDIFDVIPYIRSFTPRAFFKQIRTTQRENGGYFLNPDGAHNLSYARSDVWGAYDALGVKNGGAWLSIIPSRVQSFGDADKL